MKDLRPDPVTRDVAAPVERCYAVLEDVERYPEWLTGVESLEVVERDAEGRVAVARVSVKLELAGLSRTIAFTAGVEREPPNRLVLRRQASQSDSEQRLVLDWSIAAHDGGSRVRLAVDAALDVPRFMPIGGAADGLVRDFADALARRVAAD